MTDEALTAPAEAVSAPEPSTPVETITVAEPTARGAIDRAFAAVEKMEGGEPEAGEPAKPEGDGDGDGRARGPDGKFLPKDEAKRIGREAVENKEEVEDKLNRDRVDLPKSEIDKLPPSRFSTDAKALWDTLPDAVKAETHRALRELEQGHEKYRADAAAFDDIREFDELARQTGTTIKAAMANYVGIERMLAADPLAGLSKIAENMGFSLKDIAAHVMGQTPDQAASQNDATIRQQLRAEIADLRQNFTTIMPTVQEFQNSRNEQLISDWAKDKPHFQHVREDVVALVKSGTDPDTAYTKAISDLQEKAKLLGLAPPPNPALAPATPDLSAQTRKGSLSVTGAPSSGSNPTNRKPPSSPREAIDRAFANVGM